MELWFFDLEAAYKQMLASMSSSVLLVKSLDQRPHYFVLPFGASAAVCCDFLDWFGAALLTILCNLIWQQWGTLKIL